VSIVPSTAERGYKVVGDGDGNEQVTVTGTLALGPLDSGPQTFVETCHGHCEVFVSTICLTPRRNRLSAAATCGNPSDGTATSATATEDFTVIEAKTVLTAELLQPPRTDANVRITYDFPHTTPGTFYISYYNGALIFHPPTYSGSLDIYVAPGTPALIEAFAHCSNYASVSVTVPVVTTEYQVRVTNVTPGITAYTEGQRAGVQPLTATVAIGTVFDVALIRKDGFLDPLVPITSRYTLLDADVAPAPWPPTLFGKDVLLRFGEDTARLATSFQAVHFGTTTLRIFPIAAGLQSVDVKIVVKRPKALGTSENQLDDAFATVGHDRGIPPQYIKGQALQEAANGRTIRVDGYRYEPCSWDVGIISTGQKLITTAPYNLFKLDDDIGTTLLPNVVDDLDPRNRLYIQSGTDPKNGKPTYRHLNDADRDVKLRDIWDANDLINSKMNWSRVKCGNLPSIQANPSVMDFVAQTPTAASYGIFQLMYGTALDAKWAGVLLDPKDPNSGSKAPKYLFDRPEYIAIGGGTIQLGSSKDVKNYQRLMASAAVCKTTTKYPTVLASHAEFETFLSLAFQAYNCYHVDPATRVPIYGPGVISKSAKQPPAQTGRFFQ
jgi:hypothetical protein